MKLGDTDGPQFFFRPGGEYRMLWRDLSGVGSWLSSTGIGTYQANTTYLAVLRCVATTTGQDTMSAVLLDLNNLPQTEPVWDQVANVTFERSNIGQVILQAQAASQGSFDNVMITTSWADIAETLQGN